MEYIEITPEFVEKQIVTYKKGGQTSEMLPSEQSSEEIQSETDFGIEMLYGGNFYNKFPDKLVGTVKFDIDRYGKDIRVVVGDISELEKINVSDDFNQFIKNKNIGVSDNEMTIANEISLPENEGL